MKSHEISMKPQKKKEIVKNVTCVILRNKYVFKVKPIFRDYTRTEAYLVHC